LPIDTSEFIDTLLNIISGCHGLELWLCPGIDLQRVMSWRLSHFQASFSAKSLFP